MQCLTYGGIITRLLVPDRLGCAKEVTLSFDDLEQYERESPYFGGREALPIAKKWFAEQVGVTFTEEVREQKVHVVRRR